MGLQRFERRLERLVEGAFNKAFRSGLQPVEIGRRLVRETRRRSHARRARHRRAERLRRCDSRPSDARALRRLRRRPRPRARRTRRVSTPATRATTSSAPSTSLLDADERLQDAATSTSSPRSSRARAGTVGALVLPDGRRVRLGRGAVRSSGGSPTARSRSPTRRSRGTTPRSAPTHDGFRVVDLGSHERHDW